MANLSKSYAVERDSVPTEAASSIQTLAIELERILNEIHACLDEISPRDEGLNKATIDPDGLGVVTSRCLGTARHLHERAQMLANRIGRI